jgi:hypothetical protein
MPFGIPSEDFHGGFGLPHEDDEAEFITNTPRKTYHVRCGNTTCEYNHHALCYMGIITLDEKGMCLCIKQKQRR